MYSHRVKKTSVVQYNKLYSLRSPSGRIYGRHNLREKLFFFMAAIQTGNSEICTNPTAINI